MPEIEEEYKDKLLYLRKMLGRNLTAPDILFMEELRHSYSMDFIEDFLGYCSEKKCSSIRDIKRLLKRIEEKSATTVNSFDLYRAQESYYNKCYELFGFRKSRMLTKKEKEYFDLWKTYLGEEIVYEAIRRTVLYANTPSIAYCDKIIWEWINKGVRTIEDVPPQ